MVLHLWGLPDADALIDGQLEELPTLLDIADQHNVMLAVEAIPCVVHDPLGLIHRVLDTDSRAKVALDTEFLGMHDQLDDVFAADWLWDADAVSMSTSRISMAASSIRSRAAVDIFTRERATSHSTAGSTACATAGIGTR